MLKLLESTNKLCLLTFFWPSNIGTNKKVFSIFAWKSILLRKRLFGVRTLKIAKWLKLSWIDDWNWIWIQQFVNEKPKFYSSFLLSRFDTLMVVIRSYWINSDLLDFGQQENEWQNIVALRTFHGWSFDVQAISSEFLKGLHRFDQIENGVKANLFNTAHQRWQVMK